MGTLSGINVVLGGGLTRHCACTLLYSTVTSCVRFVGFVVAGATRLAKEMGPGHTIVTILCDLGTRYQGKIFNVEFLKSKGLPFPAWMDPSVPSGVPEVFEEVEQV